MSRFLAKINSYAHFASEQSLIFRSVLFSSLFLTLFLFSGSVQAGKENYLVRCNQKLVDVIMEDLFSPAVASRVKVYPNIAAYEILSKKSGELRSFQGKLTGLDPIPAPMNKVDYSLSALFAFTTVAKKLVYSEHLFKAFEDKEEKNWLIRHKNETALLKNSKEYANKVAQHIIMWIQKDNYDYTRTLSRYVLSDSAGAWVPTSPAYANALEPNWGLMRSLVFDSTNQIKVIPNFPYSEDTSSVYYKNAIAVYNQSLDLDTAKRLTAWYWDDNPNILKSNGHVMYFIHKVSPCGHWVRIASQAIKNRGLNEYETAKVFAILSVGIYEAFIGCWKEKYSSNAVRPETYFNRVISPQWKSYIETPPFPEYSSGHSVTSSTSATILMALIEQPYVFTDSSVMYINLPPRRFNSFREASDQASISRFYGGIHYMPSLDNGIIQGKEIGNFIVEKLNGK